ncbi:MAG: LamG domain-containing protein [Candidatus Aenigmarchaeota archaeon]|nr:LamG domain-containing protein [Candidatus Aenigmarchaeota archaeon]
MLKAISTIIATILILSIVMVLAGSTFLFASGILTGKISNSFSILDTFNDTVTIRDEGTDYITSMTATLDSNNANVAIVPNIAGLVGYWSFNEGNGTAAYDNSGNRNDGNLNGVYTWVTGNCKFGSCLQFSGNGYVEIQKPSAGYPANWTLSAYIRPSQNQFSTVAGFVGECKDFAIGIQPNNQISSWVTTPVPCQRGYSSNGVMAQNTNYYIVGTFDGTILKIYVNGIFQNTTSASGDSSAAGPLRIGSAGDCCPTEKFYGTIDEVALFNRALTGAEVQQLYSGIVSPSQTATVKFLPPLTKGMHSLRLCSPSMCNTGYVTIQ